ncbi:HIT-like domain-containing protein [Radiomyces spectabilis]|uniref:HIT-like domain-containing protein n=1 Tax=Radiomyces spectabilis TaxID=64574 RepID=UPI0022209F64|nr:HIT-like domain-containing protein [Radiomyces spectabilis]KAI8388153.1 HIT-like domain-containing protein [Radiomyces spectabilis]
MATTHLTDDCIFCKIIRGEIPSHKVAETDKSYCFLDINPLSEGHALVIPKYHAQFFHELPDDHLADLLPLAKKVAVASGLDQYNLLQNNGAMAHQVVPHVHFHIIPKPSQEQGLKIGWPQQQPSQDDLKKTLGRIKEKL